ncbi:MAG: DUF1848 family protein [Polyangiaceae bacterium]|nr:DUF1848 family protein [Polyangiaceae bacterium]
MHAPRSSAPPRRHLVSVSRRTDIPRFFADWFAARRAAGFAEYENVFGVRGRVSLLRSDVLGYLFWTRDARPLEGELAALRRERIPFAFQFTITCYGTELEPNRPPLDEAIASFLELARALPSPESIQWRYDPIVISRRYPPEFHLEAFTRIAERLRGATLVANVSVVEPLLKAVRRLGDRDIRYRSPDPRRHAATVRRFPGLRSAGEAGAELVPKLAATARAQGMVLRSCADPELGLPPAQCCGPDLWRACAEIDLAELASVPKAPSRAGCHCIQSVDIGMSETCRGGCRYCYVTSSDRAVAANADRYDPSQPSLRAPRGQTGTSRE